MDEVFGRRNGERRNPVLQYSRHDLCGQIDPRSPYSGFAAWRSVGFPVGAGRMVVTLRMYLQSE
jgi:hypothetical protein